MTRCHVWAKSQMTCTPALPLTTAKEVHSTYYLVHGSLVNIACKQRGEGNFYQWWSHKLFRVVYRRVLNQHTDHKFLVNRWLSWLLTLCLGSPRPLTPVHLDPLGWWAHLPTPLNILHTFRALRAQMSGWCTVLDHCTTWHAHTHTHTQTQHFATLLSR